MIVEAKDKMRVVILTPYKRLLDLSGVSEVYFPVEYGSIGVLPGHAPLVTAVGTGVVLYTQNDVSGFFEVAGGVAEITGSSVTLLVDVGEDAAHIDSERAKRSLERAEARLISPDNHTDLKRAEAAKNRAMARLEAVEMFKTKGSHRNKQNN